MSTKTTLAPANGADLATTDMRDAILAERAADAERNAFDFMPQRIKMPSGGLQVFTLSDGDTMKPFTGIIAVSQKSRAYWPDKETQGLPPMCSSPDGAAGWLNADADAGQLAAARRAFYPHLGLETITDHTGPFDCNRCPLSAWGSGDGRGQACKSLRRLLVLVDGWSMPALLTLPPTSVKVFDQYASGRASKGSAYFAVRTKFELEQKRNPAGVNFSVVKLSYVEDLNDETMGAVFAVREQFAELVRSMEISADEYTTDNPPF